MKQFDLELAKQGHPVCTRDGRKARIIEFNYRSSSPIVAIIETKNGCESIETYDNEGRWDSIKHDNDLMMASVKHEGWVNVYSDNGYYVDKEIWDFEENATEIGKEFPDYVATVKIEWEE